MGFSKPNTSFLSICTPFPLNASKEFKVKNNSSDLKIYPIPGRVFQTLDKQGCFLARVRKTAIKAMYFTQIT